MQWSCLIGAVFSLLNAKVVLAETRVSSLSREDPLEEEMATHSSILAWRIAWTEEGAWQATVHRVTKSET